MKAHLPSAVHLDGVTYVFDQESDSCAPTDEVGQELIIEVVDAVGGPYAVLKTERWAVDRSDISWIGAVIEELLGLCEREGGD